jgi:hypothetical protein
MADNEDHQPETKALVSGDKPEQSNVKVAVRCRPLEGGISIVNIADGLVKLKNPDTGIFEHEYQFDYVYDSNTIQVFLISNPKIH